MARGDPPHALVLLETPGHFAAVSPVSCWCCGLQSMVGGWQRMVELRRKERGHCCRPLPPSLWQRCRPQGLATSPSSLQQETWSNLRSQLSAIPAERGPWGQGCGAAPSTKAGLETGESTGWAESSPAMGGLEP